MKLFDKLFDTINKQLSQEFKWLETFGKAQTLTSTSGRGPVRFPAMYGSNNNYISLAPEGRRGNISFCILTDPQKVDMSRGRRSKIEGKFSIVFWLDLRTVPGVNRRDTELVKSDLLDFFSDKLLVRNGSVNLVKIWEGAKNIYAEYNLNEIKDQYLMHPYAGLRFDFEAIINQECHE